MTLAPIAKNFDTFISYIPSMFTTNKKSMYSAQYIPQFRIKRNEYANIYKMMSATILFVVLGGVASLFVTNQLPTLMAVVAIGIATQLVVMQFNAWKNKAEINAYRKELRFRTLPFTPFKKISWNKIEEIVSSKNTVFVALKNGKVYALNTPKAQIVNTHLQQYLMV